MRLWSLHPKYLDRQGLLAVRREALLAPKVLQNRTAGYRNHPQLERFKEHPDSLAAIASYLRAVYGLGKALAKALAKPFQAGISLRCLAAI